MNSAIVLALWCNFASAMALFGGTAFPLLLDRRILGPFFRRRLSFILIPAAFFCLAAGIGLLLLESASMAGDWSAALDPETIGAVLTDTVFGKAWIVHLGLALLVPACLVIRLPRQVPVLAAAALLASLALTGHAAMAEGTSGFWLRLNQAIHLLAAGSWIGGLLPLTLAVLDPGLSFEMKCGALRRFTAYGGLSLALIVASGVVNAVSLIHPLRSLPASAYGRTLLVKLGLVALMAVIALVNRQVLLPRLASGSALATSSLRISLLAEIATGILVLAVASLLGTLAPAVAQG